MTCDEITDQIDRITALKNKVEYIADYCSKIKNVFL